MLKAHFVCPQKFTKEELLHMCLNNFRNNLSTNLMAQTFEGFNDLCTKAHDMELHSIRERNHPKRAPRLGISWPLRIRIFQRIGTIEQSDNYPPKEHSNSTSQHPLAGSTTKRDTRPIFQERTTEGVFFLKGSY